MKGPLACCGAGRGNSPASAPPSPAAADYHRDLVIDAKQAEWLLAEARASELGPSALLGLKSRSAEAKAEEAEQKTLEKKLGISECGKPIAGTSGSATSTSA